MMYVIAAHEIGAMKIGISRDPRRRLANLQTAFPSPLVIVHVLPECGPKEESAFHRALRDHRLQGEWFRMTDDSLSQLAGLMSGHVRLDADGLAGYVPPPPAPKPAPSEPPPEPEVIEPSIQPEGGSLSEESPDGCFFDREVFARADIPASAKILHMGLISLPRLGYRDATVARICEAVNMSRRAARDNLRILREKGLVPIPSPPPEGEA